MKPVSESTEDAWEIIRDIDYVRFDGDTVCLDGFFSARELRAILLILEKEDS